MLEQDLKLEYKEEVVEEVTAILRDAEERLASLGIRLEIGAPIPPKKP